MTPREDADRLYEAMYYKLAGKVSEDENEHKLATECALVAVNEILDIVRSDDSAIIVQLQHWIDVKREIQKDLKIMFG